MDPKDIQSVSVVPADGMIAINGEAYSGCDVAQERHDLYGPVHAIQWWSDHGQIEHARGPAIGFTDVAQVLRFIPAWLERRAEVLREIATHHETQLKHATQNLEGHKIALDDIAAHLSIEKLDGHVKGRLERVRDDIKARIEHFTGLHEKLTTAHAEASAKADQAEKDAG